MPPSIIILDPIEFLSVKDAVLDFIQIEASFFEDLDFVGLNGEGLVFSGVFVNLFQKVLAIFVEGGSESR
jgi:hypothetical protein